MLCTEGAEWGGMFQYAATRLKRIGVGVTKNWKKDSGAELLEAALVIPVLLMLLLGIFSFGRAWDVYQTMTRAAREGAREAVLTPCALCSGPNYSTSDIFDNFIDPAMQNANLNPTQISSPNITYVNLDPNATASTTLLTPCNTGDGSCTCGVQVAFQYPYTFSLPFTSLNMSTINLSTTVQMRLENQPDTCPAGTAYAGPNP